MAESETDKRRTEESSDSEVKITDRRLFTPDGKLRHELPVEDEPEEEEAQASASPASGERSRPATAGSRDAARFEHRPVEEPQGVDFTMLLNAMAQPALLFLGEIPHPGTGQATVDLEQARIQIDMLELLRVKCRGNLTADEEGLLDRILYQLRMLYVSRSSRAPA